MPSIIQHKTAIDYSGTDIASKIATLDANWTLGNAILVAVRWDVSSTQVASVIAGVSNTCVAQTMYSWGIGTSKLQYFLCKNLVGTPGAVITASFVPNSPYIGMEVFEISGQDAATQPDVATAGQYNAFNTTTDNITSGNITTVTDGCLVIETMIREYTAGTVTEGTGFTGISPLLDGSTVVLKSGYRVQATAGSIAGTFTQSQATAALPMVVAIRPSAAVTNTNSRNVSSPGIGRGHLGGPTMMRELVHKTKRYFLPSRSGLLLPAYQN